MSTSSKELSISDFSDSALRGLSVQLYSLREASKDDFDAVLATLAEQGFDAVEPFNLFGKSPREFARQVEGLGMQISSSHYPWGTHAAATEIADVLGEFGLRRAIGGFMPDDVRTEDALKATIDKVNRQVQALAQEGISLALHNHWWEFERIAASANGSFIHHRLQADCPDIEFELDTYWAANFGAVDVATETARVAHRTPLLHIKDGPLVKGEPMVAVGSGAMDIPAVVGAANPDVLEWLIVELDECATDMSAAVGQSRQFLETMLRGDDA